MNVMRACIFRTLSTLLKFGIPLQAVQSVQVVNGERHCPAGVKSILANARGEDLQRTFAGRPRFAFRSEAHPGRLKNLYLKIQTR